MKALFFAAVFISGQFASAAIMDLKRAEATLKDPRLNKFYEAMKASFGAECAFPAAESLDAEAKCNGGGDFSSCYYTFHVQCTGQDGFYGMAVNVEFMTPSPVPLNMALTVKYRE